MQQGQLLGFGNDLKIYEIGAGKGRKGKVADIADLGNLGNKGEKGEIGEILGCYGTS
jgi:hypothetical protein